jgi:hypothetical protein
MKTLETQKRLAIRRNRKESGYTLLEYAAGAALLMGVLYVGLRAVGGSLEGLMTSIANFANRRATELDTKAPD